MPTNTPIPIFTASCRGPKLLVSVRNADEAASALSGGCEILDVKDPLRGPLGMANVDTMESILQSRSGMGCDVPISVALGETIDWVGRNDIPEIPGGITYAKLGSAELSGRPNWRRQWCEVQRRFDEARCTPFGWIAVAYADWRRALAPTPDSIIDLAIDEGFCGVLIDTFDKAGSGLRDSLSTAELSGMVERSRRAGILLALAGKLRQDDIPEMAATGADIIGIRGAVCRGGHRQAEVCGQLVRQFKDSLEVNLTSTNESANPSRATAPSQSNGLPIIP